MRRTRLAVVIGVAALLAVGLGAGVAWAYSSSTSALSTVVGTNGSMGAYCRSRMGSYAGTSMMGGGSSSVGTMGPNGYAWMMGGVNSPGWMHGGTLPSSMMGASTDPGKAMGSLWANAPGPRVAPPDATRLGNAVPTSATVNRSANRIAFSTTNVHFVALASPSGGPDETFRIAGMVRPTVVVPTNSHVSIEVINADPDTAHGLVVTTEGGSSSWMPMMTSRSAFSGSAVWFLGDPTSAGMHAGTLSFTANRSGTYNYLCAVPGHAQKGMVGRFVAAG